LLEYQKVCGEGGFAAKVRKGDVAKGIVEPHSQRLDPSSMSADQAALHAVVVALHNATSPEQIVRSAAEASLLELMTTQSESAVQLFLHLADDVLQPVHLRQMCLVLLGQLINQNRWDQLTSYLHVSLIEFAFKGCEATENPVRKASVRHEDGGLIWLLPYLASVRSQTY